MHGLRKPRHDIANRHSNVAALQLTQDAFFLQIADKAVIFFLCHVLWIKFFRQFLNLFVGQCGLAHGVLFQFLSSFLQLFHDSRFIISAKLQFFGCGIQIVTSPIGAGNFRHVHAESLPPKCWNKKLLLCYRHLEGKVKRRAQTPAFVPCAGVGIGAVW